MIDAENEYPDLYNGNSVAHVGKKVKGSPRESLKSERLRRQESTSHCNATNSSSTLIPAFRLLVATSVISSAVYIRVNHIAERRSLVFRQLQARVFAIVIPSGSGKERTVGV